MKEVLKELFFIALVMIAVMMLGAIATIFVFKFLGLL
jgi:hypothetical protein